MGGKSCLAGVLLHEGLLPIKYVDTNCEIMEKTQMQIIRISEQNYHLEKLA